MDTNKIVNNDTEFSQEHRFVQEVLNDFKICCLSREASLLGRKEVLRGKAKFGILGDGKEVPQVAMARAFKKGDFRSGYYRDQTFMMALELCSLEDYFAQLYADVENDPFSAGRQMNAHFATPLIDANGNWTNHVELYNITADISSTGGQMARALGVALASKKYRESAELRNSTQFSKNGNEVSFCTIGDASTSEGIFWEVINAACVMRVPLAISVWDDGYGISVPAKYQTTKQNISDILEGFRLDEDGNGMDIYTVKAWDYPALCEVYEQAIEKTRLTHIPCLIHVQEVTQPQGHSTSGSHERYKSQERLAWEHTMDCNLIMKQWIIDSGIASEDEVNDIEQAAKLTAKEACDKAWNNFIQPVIVKQKELIQILENIPNNQLQSSLDEIKALRIPSLGELVELARRTKFQLVDADLNVEKLNTWIGTNHQLGINRYNTHLNSETPNAALSVTQKPPLYSHNSPNVNGYEVLNKYFDIILQKQPNIFAFGEDVGYIGDVNQGFAGLQTKFGEERVFDTGIREWSIMGQAIGMAMRGLRPIAEIQYLDYLIYGLEPLSDDLATLRYRSNGQQAAPAIIRTRGHRLEGIWHSGSPIGLLINALRGMYICVPRNMTQAVGMYQTLMQSDDPALVIECLNGYRLKEQLPDNIGEYCVALGVPETLQEGSDVTLVTYGSCVRIAQKATQMLAQHNVSVELIDVQTLLPFDTNHLIVKSLQKTNRIVFLDEDVPGGATAFMLREVLEVQNGYHYLDTKPVCLTANASRPPYGSDGDYFSKPNAEDVFEAIIKLCQE
ncbi:MAG: thiamine pyrophosphate-dependent enzyme [Saprospiraceae bacterium]